MTATRSNDASDYGDDVSRGVVKMWSRIDHSLMVVETTHTTQNIHGGSQYQRRGVWRVFSGDR